MKLTTLEGQFLRLSEDGRWAHVETLDAAQGVMFLCPICWVANGGDVGTHSVVTWFRDRGVSDDEVPGPGRWIVSGTGIDDLTLSPSIHLSGKGGCGWHGWVKSGDAS